MDADATRVIYLNNAADGWPKAPGVAEAVSAELRAVPHLPGRSSTAATDHAAACRNGLARLLDVPDPARIVLTQHATHALNLALMGLGAHRTRRVVTSVAEHNSITRPLARLQTLAGITVVRIGLRGGMLDEQQYADALRDPPGLVVLQHASNVTGNVQDIARLFALAKAAGAVTLLDAAQTVGHIAVRPRELHADLVALTGRKGLHGPPGTGALWVAPELELEQVFTGGTGVHGNLTRHPEMMPTRLECGTPNAPALAGWAAALDWALHRDAAHTQRLEQLGALLLAGLRAIPGVTVYGAGAGPRTPVVSFSIAGVRNDRAGQELWERYGVVCRTGLHCAPLIHADLGSAPHGTVRFSASSFTTPAEIAAALDGVRELSQEAD